MACHVRAVVDSVVLLLAELADALWPDVLTEAATPNPLNDTDAAARMEFLILSTLADELVSTDSVAKRRPYSSR